MKKGSAVQRENSDHAFFIFRRYDQDNSGTMSADDLRSLLQDYTLGVRLTDEEAALACRLLCRGGSSGGGEVSYKDFAAWWAESSDTRFRLLQWTPEELESLRVARDAFALLDRDQNGLISRSEFRVLHRRLLAEGFEVPEKLDECLALVDTNGSGTVDFGEFVVFLRRIDAFRKREVLVVEKREEEEKARSLPPEKYVSLVLERTNYAVLKAFSKYDVDHSSSISASEFRRLVRDLGFHLTQEEAKLQVKLISTRGNDEIEFGEFKAWWMSEARVENLKWDEQELAKYRFFSELFDEFDADQSGIIDEAEFGLLYEKMVAMGFSLLQDTASMLEAISGSKTGAKVNFNAFTNYLKKIGAFQFWKKQE